MASINYKFLEHQDTRVNYSFMPEKEACKNVCNSNVFRVKYLFLEYSEENK